jgi:enoyl-CoA hydratase/carnithine racemase
VKTGLEVTNKLLEREADMDLNHALEFEVAEQARLIQARDCKEACHAFIEKRLSKFNQP